MCVPRLPRRMNPRFACNEVRVIAKRLATLLLAFTFFGFSACGGGVSRAGPLKPTVPVRTGQPGAPVISSQKHPAPPSPNMIMTISPTSGPAGTAVRIAVTGCIDVSGLNHAVGFNWGAIDQNEAMANRNNPSIVVDIPAALSGTTLTALQTITQQETAFGGGSFSVQCGGTVKFATFTVTK